MIDRDHVIINVVKRFVFGAIGGISGRLAEFRGMWRNFVAGGGILGQVVEFCGGWRNFVASGDYYWM